MISDVTIMLQETDVLPVAYGCTPMLGFFDISEVTYATLVTLQPGKWISGIVVDCYIRQAKLATLYYKDGPGDGITQIFCLPIPEYMKSPLHLPKGVSPLPTV